MDKIAQYAMKNPTFREIVGTNRLPWDGAEWKSELINHNKLIRNYEGATGIKNGFTDQAMHTLVGSAKRGETELIAVTMKAPSSVMAYRDVTAMLDYGFANFETRPIADAGETFTRPAARKGETDARFAAKEDLYATVPIGTEPDISLKPNGRLFVSAGPLTISYPLDRLDSPVEVKAAADSAALQRGQAERAYDAQAARYGLLFVWLAFNLFLIGCLMHRSRRHKGVRRREL
jgi:D-alanyl-D-alanine carboxypeptidase/D-alanyl-D-alanine carboxypeptidase (penicillin-binding protein 5/6)